MSIIAIDSKPYICYIDKTLKSIIPEEIQYLSIEESGKELARLIFSFGDKWEDYVDIEPSDLLNLTKLLDLIGCTLSLPQELLKYAH